MMTTSEKQWFYPVCAPPLNYHNMKTHMADTIPRHLNITRTGQELKNKIPLEIRLNLHDS